MLVCNDATPNWFMLHARARYMLKFARSSFRIARARARVCSTALMNRREQRARSLRTLSMASASADGNGFDDGDDDDDDGVCCCTYFSCTGMQLARCTTNEVRILHAQAHISPRDTSIVDQIYNIPSIHHKNNNTKNATT